MTFVASSGDSGSPGYFPAYSPNVLATGGTTLNINADNSYQSETAWSGSGGGTSLYESEPVYQDAVQSTGKRTIPDVAWDADPNTGVAVYDSWDDTDNSGPWLEIGGTSVAAPSWSQTDRDRKPGAAGSRRRDDPRRPLSDLAGLALPRRRRVTSTTSRRGATVASKAGPGYDEVHRTARDAPGEPTCSSLGWSPTERPPRSSSPTSRQRASSSGTPSGLWSQPRTPRGATTRLVHRRRHHLLGSHPTGGDFEGRTLSVTTSDGRAVFNGLTLNKIGSYSFQVASSGFPTVKTPAFNVINNPSPGAGTYYPVATDSSLRAAIAAADSNAFASNTIVLSVGTYGLTNPADGEIVIKNTSSLPTKTLTIVGAGEASTIIQPSVYPWLDRVFEVVSSSGTSLSVTFQELTISGGNATGGGILGGNVALGGAMLIDGGTVRMTNVAVVGNEAQGAAGGAGKTGSSGPSEQEARPVQRATPRGSGIYLAAGTLTLTNDTVSNNIAEGGGGSSGGEYR